MGSKNFTQAELSELVRDLDLPKTKAELLGSRLQQWNLLEEGVKVSIYRKREAILTLFFAMEGELVYCHDIPGLMAELNLPYTPDQCLPHYGMQHVAKTPFSPFSFGFLSRKFRSSIRKHGERFHQDITSIEKRYTGKWSPNMLADYCWNLIRETPGDFYKKKEKFRKLISNGYIALKFTVNKMYYEFVIV